MKTKKLSKFTLGTLCAMQLIPFAQPVLAESTSIDIKTIPSQLTVEVPESMLFNFLGDGSNVLSKYTITDKTPNSTIVLEKLEAQGQTVGDKKWNLVDESTDVKTKVDNTNIQLRAKIDNMDNFMNLSSPIEINRKISENESVDINFDVTRSAFSKSSTEIGAIILTPTITWSRNEASEGGDSDNSGDVKDEVASVSAGFKFDEPNKQIIGYEGEDKTIVVPNKINNVTVQSLKEESITNTKANKILIPDNVNTIETNALKNNTNLNEIEFGYTDMPTLNDGVFTGSTNLKKITVPAGAKSITEDAVTKSGLDVNDVTIVERTSIGPKIEADNIVKTHMIVYNDGKLENITGNDSWRQLYSSDLDINYYVGQTSERYNYNDYLKTTMRILETYTEVKKQSSSAINASSAIEVNWNGNNGLYTEIIYPDGSSRGGALPNIDKTKFNGYKTNDKVSINGVEYTIRTVWN